MKIEQLAASIPGAKVRGDGSTEIKSIQYDSRAVKSGDLFCAIKGEKFDGNEYIDNAVRSGAAGVLTSSRELSIQVPVINVPNDREGMALAAHSIYNNPTSRLEVLGITGTNGKTTSLIQLQSILKYAGYKTGRIGTLGWEIDGFEEENERTTPEAIDILDIIAGMEDRDASHVVMEVTSIATIMHRVSGFDFRGGLFLNLTQDHLDLHGSMEEYFKAKKLFFEMLPENTPGAVNGDDPYGPRMLENVNCKPVVFSFNSDSDVRGETIENSSSGLKINITGIFGEFTVESPLIGGFNAENILGVIALALAYGIDSETIVKGLANAPQVRGRMEKIVLPNGANAVVDYAHAPGAIDKALEALKPITGGRLIIVFGAGGDRDTTKRALMGEIASRMADSVIITSDNPRTENPEKIIENIKNGVVGNNVSTDTDRASAIRKAITGSGKGDTVLIAGKGHETYQEINGIKHHFDDREEVLKIREEMS